MIRAVVHFKDGTFEHMVLPEYREFLEFRRVPALHVGSADEVPRPTTESIVVCKGYPWVGDGSLDMIYNEVP